MAYTLLNTPAVTQFSLPPSYLDQETGKGVPKGSDVFLFAVRGKIGEVCCSVSDGLSFIRGPVILPVPLLGTD